MNNLITFIIENWYIFITVASMVVGVAVIVYNYNKLPKSEQIEKLQEWLLYAVVEAEHVLGSGTGKIKLRMVYDMFIGKFPTLAKIFAFETFSGLVDSALDKMEDLLKSDKNLAQYAGREDDASNDESKQSDIS